MSAESAPWQTWRVYLSDFEPVLPRIAWVLRTRYDTGSFTLLDERFQALGRERLEWTLQGPRGRLTVTLERGEGYSLGVLQAPQPAFDEGRELLRRACEAQGGKPDAIEPG